MESLLCATKGTISVCHKWEQAQKWTGASQARPLFVRAHSTCTPCPLYPPNMPAGLVLMSP